MDAIGNEVGQKMRSAIKAKLMELGCYVDDELPDYIMVMVANKRTRVQMELDLQLFLRSNTEEFVDWLQQVLKKLKEVRLTNPELYACKSFGELKRKASLEMAECVIRKEKREKRLKSESSVENDISKSLSDDIPVNATKLVENRAMNRIVELAKENNEVTKSNVNEDNFDIPSISEVNLLADSELEVVADKIKKAKIILMKSDSEDEDFINIKADTEELLGSELCDISSSTNVVTDNKKCENPHKQTISLVRQRSNISSSNQIMTENPKLNLRSLSDLRNSLINNKTSALKSLGSHSSESTDNTYTSQKKMINLTESLREEKEISGKIFSNIANKTIQRKGIILKRDGKDKKESVHSRLGVPSTVVSVVALPKKKEVLEQPSSPERVVKSVPSTVQVKPRKISTNFCQANKALLLKAVAEAQRSVAQMPPRMLEEKKALFTKKYQEKRLKELQKTPEKLSIRKTITKQPKNIVVEVISNKTNQERRISSEQSNESNSHIVHTSTKINSGKNTLLEEPDYSPSVDIDLNFEEDLDKYMDDLDSFQESNSNSVSESINEEQEVTESQTKHQFIVTLDGLKNKPPFKKNGSSSPTSTTNIGESPKQIKRPPSPIVFDKKENPPVAKPARKIPEMLPKVSLIKERCKYWPACRLGDSCEYIHPNLPCKLFPNCKFGDRCLYIHPKCKFYASCTKKDCAYSHGIPKSILKTVIKQHMPYHPPFQPPLLEVCKYFPKCVNLKCAFYHPKPCKFGVACLNKAECGFSHNLPSKEKLTWHSVK